MAVEEKQRINISLADKDDCSKVLRLRDFYQKKLSKPVTMAEAVRLAIVETITKNKI